MDPTSAVGVDAATCDRIVPLWISIGRRAACPWHYVIAAPDIYRYDQRAEALGSKGMIQTDNM